MRRRLAEAVHEKLVLSRYDWLIKHLSLLEKPREKLWRVAEIVVETEGNSSERAGAKFAMYPSWAWERAKLILRAARNERGRFFEEIDRLLDP